MILGLSAPHAVAATTWQSSDIGDVGAPGSANGTNDSLIVAGAGADIYAEADAFQFAYQPWNGDGEIVARISRLEDINPWSKAGLMFRGSLEANSANVFIFMTPENGVGIQSRTNTGGSTDFSPATFVTPPAWLKLARLGNLFQAYQSLDGTNWILAGSVRVSMTQSLYVGMAVCSHQQGVVCHANFDSIALTASVDVPPPPSALRITGVGPDRFALQWSDNSINEGGFEIQSSTNGIDFGTGPGNWTWTTPANATNLVAFNQFTFQPLTRYYLRVRATSAAGPSPWSDTVTGTTLKLWSPWENQDIGVTGANGDSHFKFFDSSGGGGIASESLGSGSGTHGPGESFQYMYVRCTGNGSVVVQVGSIESSNSSAIGGLMLRQSLNPGSPYVAALASAGGWTQLESRDTPGGSVQVVGGPSYPFSASFKITRSNNVFTAYVDTSNDVPPENWLYLGSATVALTDPFYLGVVCSSAQPGTVARVFTYGVNASFSVPPSLSDLAFNPNGLTASLTLVGSLGRSYTVDTSSNLVNWSSLTSISNSVGHMFLSDPAAAGLPRRFYRAELAP